MHCTPQGDEFRVAKFFGNTPGNGKRVAGAGEIIDDGLHDVPFNPGFPSRSPEHYETQGNSGRVQAICLCDESWSISLLCRNETGHRVISQDLFLDYLETCSGKGFFQFSNGKEL